MTLIQRYRDESWYDYYYIIKSFIWDNPILISEGLYLGNATHCLSLTCIVKHNINAIINVTNCVSNLYSHLGIEYLNIPINDINDADISKYLKESYEFIDKNIQEGKNVLVHCLMGRSRSVAICVYYLMKKQNIDFMTAYKMIETKKSYININLSFVKQLSSETNK